MLKNTRGFVFPKILPDINSLNSPNDTIKDVVLLLPFSRDVKKIMNETQLISDS